MNHADKHLTKLKAIQDLFDRQMALRKHIERLVPTMPLYSKKRDEIEDNERRMVEADEQLMGIMEENKNIKGVK